jgi:hypothetical protein
MITKLPPLIRKLFGTPPVLPSEDPEVYSKLLLQTANARNLAENDTIGWLLAKDIVDDAWEILRDRKINVDILQMNLELVSASGCKDITDEDEERVYRSLVEGSIRGKTRALLQGLELHESMNSLLSSAMGRRNANIRDSQRHAESMAASSIPAQATTHGSSHSAAVKKGVVTPASPGPDNGAAQGSSVPGKVTKVIIIPATSHSGPVIEKIVTPANPVPKKGAA